MANLSARILQAILHSQTLLLYLFPSVSILAEGVRLFAITKETPSGSYTSSILAYSLNSMKRAFCEMKKNDEKGYSLFQCTLPLTAR